MCFFFPKRTFFFPSFNENKKFFAQEMCGIVIVFGVQKGAESIRDRVLERVRRIRHRGPDWSGVYCKGTTIMAHERLSIVDVASGSSFSHLFPFVNAFTVVIRAFVGLFVFLQKPLFTGSQPLFTEEKDCVLGVNGEIYNHLAVREEMEEKGYKGRFMTKSDCEIILHLYKVMICYCSIVSFFYSLFLSCSFMHFMHIMFVDRKEESSLSLSIYKYIIYL